MAESLDSKLDNKELIQAVRSYECLYMKKHQDYKNKRIKDAAWEEVALMLENTAYNCKTRWRSLCDRNRKELTENTGPSGPIRKPWKLREDMAFVNESMEEEKTYVNYNFMNGESEAVLECQTSQKRKEDDPLVKKKRKSEFEDESFFDLLRAKFMRLNAEEKDEVQIDILSLVVNKIKNRNSNHN